MVASISSSTVSDWSNALYSKLDTNNQGYISKTDLEAAYAKAYQIQVSDDGLTWNTIYSTTTGAGGTETLNFTGTGRYIRLYGTQRATQYGYSLWEFQVFGS